MTRKSPKTQDPHERNMEIALFRFGLISASKLIIIPLNLVSVFWGEAQ